MQYKKPLLIITSVTTVIGVISYLYLTDIFKPKDKDEKCS